jgi:RimJ/RimL family protein N-acetyltransferase
MATLTTERLILRPPTHADFDGWAEMCAEEDTMRFIGGTCPRDAAWRQLAAMAGAWATLGYGMFSVIERDSGKWIGRLGPWRPGGKEGGWPGDEIGYGVIRAAQGRGLAYEGCCAAIDWALDHLRWDGFIHCIDPDNKGSAALAKRLGSAIQRSGKLMPAPFDTFYVDIWGQTKTQWRSAQRARTA